MNFSYLENQMDFEPLYTACREAEEFALTKPDISATSARKAMEYIVKYIYNGIEPYPPYGCTVYDMIRDLRFQNQFADPSMLDSINYIRRAGNAAVHKGSLTVDDSLCVLEHLHFLTGEFAVGIGLIHEYAEFKKPEPDVLGELLASIHPDNLLLNLLPYVRSADREDWGESLSRYGKKHIAELKNIPKELNNEAFYGFLQGFRQSKKTEVAEILGLLPLSSATEREWRERRSTVPKSSIAKVECFVMAYIEDNQRAYTQKWTYYNEALGEKAAAYLQLAHPDYIPESMRSAYVKPDAADVGDANEFISLEDAVKQLLRYIVAENARKRDLMSLTSWCKTNLEISVPVIRTSIGSDHPDRALYSKEKVHMGDKKFYVFLQWNKISLMRLRQMSGGLGEMLITMDRLADWGFAVPGSDADKRAKERAQKREILLQAQPVEVAEEAKPAEPAVVRRKYTRMAALPEDEISPSVTRDYILGIGLEKWIPMLASAEWCRIKLGSEHPLLISHEERQYLLKKQKHRGETPHIYSRTICEHNGKTYYIKRMKTEEYDRLKAVIEHNAM